MSDQGSKTSSEKGRPRMPFSAYLGDEPYIFVSYAVLDASIVYPEISRLHQAGYRIWYDEGIDPTRHWTEVIGERIKTCSLFLVFVTPRSVLSKNCKNEITLALKREKPIVLVHLEKTELPVGLDLTIGGLQAIMKFALNLEDYERKLARALPTDLKSSNSPQEPVSSAVVGSTPWFEGRVHITSEPSDAQVWIDDHEAGVTPFTHSLPPKKRVKVRVAKVGYRKSSLSVTVPASVHVKLTADDPVSTEELKRLRTTITDLIPKSLVRNPFVPCEGLDAYEVLAVAGVGPSSSMAEILGSSETLMRRGLRTREVRAAQDRLRFIPSRMYVDFLSHRGPDPDRLREISQELEIAATAPNDRVLASRLGRDAGLVVTSLGFRRRSRACWERLFQRSPHEAGLSHDLGLFYLGSAETLERCGKIEEATESWKTCIAHLTRALTEPEYEEKWRADRASVYEQEISMEAWQETKATVADVLPKRWVFWTEQHRAAGRADRAVVYEVLAHAWHAERRGADLVNLYRGLPVRDRRVVAGPLLVGKMKIEDSVARLVSSVCNTDTEKAADLAEASKRLEDGPQVESQVPASCLGLRCFFSVLAGPVAALEMGNPVEALALLERLACDRCTSPVSVNTKGDGRCATGSAHPHTCQPDCPEFERLNPAYRLLPDRYEVFTNDARTVALQARQQVAEMELASPACDLDRLFLLWRESCQLARPLDRVEEVLPEIRELALGRATVIDRDRADWARSFTLAIDLLDRTIKEFGDTTEGYLAAKLAEVLYDRGVRMAKQSRLYEEAVRDFRRAFTLTSHNPRVRDLLCWNLINWALELNEENHVDLAREQMEEAERLLAEGQELHPGFPGFNETREALQNGWRGIDPTRAQSLDDLIKQVNIKFGDMNEDQVQSVDLTTSGLEKMQQGDLEGAISDFREARRLDPHNIIAENGLVDALVRLGEKRIVAWELVKGIALMEAAVKEFPRSTRLRRTHQTLKALAGPCGPADMKPDGEPRDR